MTAVVTCSKLDRAFLCHIGVVIRSHRNPSSADAVVHAPFTLFPSPMLRSCFEQAGQVQTDFNLLMYNVAKSPEFLHECLSRFHCWLCVMFTKLDGAVSLLLVWAAGIGGVRSLCIATGCQSIIHCDHQRAGIWHLKSKINHLLSFVYILAHYLADQ